MRKKLSFLRWVCMAAFILAVLIGVVTGTQAESYYQGKVITMVLPTGAGGGADVWTRMLANHLPRFIPGNPTIIVRNMPAGGGLVGANYAYAAKPDGKTLLICTGKNLMNEVLRPKGTVHELGKMPPAYAAPFGNIMYTRTNLIASPKDIVKAKGLVFGHGAAVGGTSTIYIVAKAVLGIESKDVLGYEGSGPARLAFLSGETNVTGAGADSYVASYKALIDKGEVIAFMQSGLLNADGDVVKDPSAPPEIPTVKELYEEIYGKSPSGIMWDVFRLILTVRSFDNAVVLPPGTKSEYVKIIQKGFVDMVNDEKFIKNADKLASGARHFVGEDLVKAYTKSMKIDEKVRQHLKDFLTTNYGAAF